MPELKIANWNIEWMNRWFTADSSGAARLRDAAEIPGVTDIADLCQRVGKVITEIGPDILTVQEGPSRISELGVFVDRFLGGAYAIHGPAGKGQQKLYTLVSKTGGAVGSVERIVAEHGFDFEDSWDVDLDRDLVLDSYGFTRPPLALRVRLHDGRSLRLLNIHAKSKYVQSAQSMWRDPARRQEFVELAVKVRKRISAEALRIREYLDTCFAAERDPWIVVTGDFNDGPGIDYFEKRYLTHNVAGLIAGSPFRPARMLRHGFVDQVAEADNWTADFFDFIAEEQRKVLLDHIMLSAGLYWDAHGKQRVSGTIEHRIFEAHAKPSAPGDRERRTSDHRPQSVTIDL